MLANYQTPSTFKLDGILRAYCTLKAPKPSVSLCIMFGLIFSIVYTLLEEAWDVLLILVCLTVLFQFNQQNRKFFNFQNYGYRYKSNKKKQFESPFHKENKHQYTKQIHRFLDTRKAKDKFPFFNSIIKYFKPSENYSNEDDRPEAISRTKKAGLDSIEKPEKDVKPKHNRFPVPHKRWYSKHAYANDDEDSNISCKYDKSSLTIDDSDECDSRTLDDISSSSGT